MAEIKMELHERELTSWEDKLVNLLEQYWLIHGRVPTQQQIAELGLDPRKYMDAFSNRTFREELANRGLGVEDPDDPKLVGWALTDKQLAAANVMLDLLDNQSRKRKLSNLGISTQEYQAWLRDPAFQGYLAARSELLLKDNKHEAHAALLDRVRTGDISAIKYYNELTGRYIPASSRAASIDPMEIIERVIEILQTNIQDKQLLAKIGQELLGLMGRTAVEHEIDRAAAVAHGSASDVSGYGNITVPAGVVEDIQQQQITMGEEVKIVSQQTKDWLAGLDVKETISKDRDKVSDNARQFVDGLGDI